MHEFDIHEFNRLPRPEISSFESLSARDLEKAFSFLFKPNRVLALHPQPEKKDEHDPGWPLKHQGSRWLIKLSLPQELEVPPCVAAISRDGWFSLWIYQTSSADEKNPSGLFPIELSPQDSSEHSAPNGSGSVNHICLFGGKLRESRGGRRLPYQFNLFRFTQHCDKDGVLFLRLITFEQEHVIKLGFGAGHYEEPIPYDYTVQSRMPACSASFHGSSHQQIGGWDGGNAFFWKENSDKWGGELYIEGIRCDKRLSLPKEYTGSLLSAAVERDGFLATGGDGDHLWFRSGPQENFIDVNCKKYLRGYIRSLELVPSALSGGKEPLILAGCDDYYLYIYDSKGKLLQKAAMGGTVDALLYLGGKNKEWFDLAVSVRNRGLFCTRLFYDQLRFEDEYKENDNRKRFATCLWNQTQRAGKDLLKQWLSSSKQSDKLYAATAVVHKPSRDLIELFAPEGPFLSKLDSNVTAYFAHILQRKIRHIAEKPYEPESQRERLRDYVALLLNMARGPYHARVAVWDLKGWLALLKAQFSQHTNVAEILSSLMEESLNTKKLMRKLAYEAFLADQSGAETKTMEKISLFLGIEKRLEVERLFSELIMLPKGDAGRVDSIAPIDLNRTPYVQTYSRRGQNKLNSFHVQQDISRITSSPEWRPSLDKEGEQQHPPVRSLISIQEKLLLVAGQRVGITEKGQEAVTWYDEKPGPLWSAAFHPDGDGETGLAVAAGEWRPGGSKEAVYAYRVDCDGKLSALPGLFPADEDWKERMRFIALAWDDEGGLWAVTGGRGNLFYWPKAAAAGREQMPPLKPLYMASTGSPQHALLVLNDRIICGGRDGVLRAFNFQGQLLWANILPGTVRAVTKMSVQHSPLGEFSDFGVITENEYLFLYNREGKQEGFLHIPSRFLLSMSCGQMRKQGAQHHLVGTLRGEIHLIEEVPKKWPASNYLFIEKEPVEKNQENKLEVVLGKEEKPIREMLRQYTKKIIGNPELCRGWCAPKFAINEPFRAAWAAHLLLTPPCRNYDAVFKMLDETRKHSGHSAQELQVHTFAHIGKMLDDIPRHCHKKILALCANARGEALAGFLICIPKYLKNIRLLLKIFDAVHKKILEGCPFVSSAVLQRLRRLPKPFFRAAVDWVIFRMLRDLEYHSNEIHSGFIEGLLTILFRRLQIDEDRLLFALSRMSSGYPRVARALLTQPGLRHIFFQWLDSHASTIFSRLNFRLWEAFSPELESEVADIPSKLAQLVKRFERMPEMANVPDVLALKNFSMLFSATSYSPPALELLPGSWHTCVRLTQEFREGLERINRKSSPTAEAEQRLKQFKRALRRFTPKLPLVNNFDEAWRQAWLNELEQSHERIFRSRSLDMFFLDSKEATGPVGRFFRVMGDAGFTRGYFYRIIQVPGCHGMLHFDYAGDSFRKKCPAHYPLDKKLADHLHEYSQTDRPSDEKLICRVYIRTEDTWSDSIFLWDRIVQDERPDAWVEVPVLRKQAQEDYQPVALFSFAWPKKFGTRLTIREQLKFKETTLRDIMDDVIRILTLEEREKERQWQQRLIELDKRLFKEADRSKIESALLEAAVEISGASGGLLIRPQGAKDKLIISAAIGEPQHWYENIRFDFKDDIHPTVLCWKQGGPVYLPDWYHSNTRREMLENIKLEKFSPKIRIDINEWLDTGIKSSVAMIIYSGDKNVGAISLQSPRPYSFDADRISALTSLLQRVRWFLHAVELSDQRRSWEYGFVHEMRSDLVPVNHGIAQALRPLSVEKNLTRAQRHCQQLLSLSENIMDMQRTLQVNRNASFPGSHEAMQEFMNLYEEPVDEAGQSISIQPDLEASIWQHPLAGNKGVFARILRNLLGNALKYGSLGADIRIHAEITEDMLQIKISNPGWMTQEENAVKFNAYERPSHARHSGAHVGLAASLVLADAYGGELTLENEENDGEQRVCALLRWPLAKKT